MSHKLLSDLDLAQIEAVKQTDGPVLIWAGAGSGKTRVLTYKVAYLILQGVDPAHILAVTFTNKAANEMRGRVIRLLGNWTTGSKKKDKPKNLIAQKPNSLSLPFVGTFHAFCAKILDRKSVV